MNEHSTKDAAAHFRAVQSGGKDLSVNPKAVSETTRPSITDGNGSEEERFLFIFSLSYEPALNSSSRINRQQDDKDLCGSSTFYCPWSKFRTMLEIIKLAKVRSFTVPTLMKIMEFDI